MIVIGLPMLLNYTFYNFIIFGISWDLIWIFWCYNACIAAYYFPGYYFITCYYLKFRLNSFEKRVKNFIKFSNHLPMRRKLLTIRRLLDDHNEMCHQIDDYNRFWKKYLTITYSIFITLICFITYTVFYSSIKWYFHLQYCVVLSAHLLLITILTYSASEVSHFNHILFNEFNSIFAKNNFPINFQLKVSLNLKLFQNYMRSDFFNI